MTIVRKCLEVYCNTFPLNQHSLKMALLLTFVMIMAVSRLNLNKYKYSNRKRWSKSCSNSGTIKYLNNFWRTLEMLLINSDINVFSNLV